MKFKVVDSFGTIAEFLYEADAKAFVKTYDHTLKIERI